MTETGSILRSLHEAHRARRARWFPAQIEAQPIAVAEESKVSAPKAPAPEPAQAVEENADIHDIALERLIRDGEILPDTRDQKPRLLVHHIIAATAEFYEYPAVEMLAYRRTKRVVYARQMAMYLAHALTLRSLPELGRMFANRDHTTVLHAVRKIGRLRDRDARVKDELQIISMRLSEQFDVPKGDRC